MDCSPPGSSVLGILQARILEWTAIPFSRGSSQPKDWTQVSFIAGGFFTVWATKGSPYIGLCMLIYKLNEWHQWYKEYKGGIKNILLLYISKSQKNSKKHPNNPRKKHVSKNKEINNQIEQVENKHKMVSINPLVWVLTHGCKFSDVHSVECWSLSLFPWIWVGL